MGLLLQEYLTSDDTLEAARCLKELEVPHFHHELVYEAVVLALEAANEETENSMVKLLKSFYDSTIVTPDQMKNVILLFSCSYPYQQMLIFECCLFREFIASWMIWTTFAWTYQMRHCTWNDWAVSVKLPD